MLIVRPKSGLVPKGVVIMLRPSVHTSHPSRPIALLLVLFLGVLLSAAPASAQDSGPRRLLLDRYYPNQAGALFVAATDSVFEDRVVISWPKSNVGSVFYRIRRDGALLTVLSSGDSSYADFGGTPGVVHSYCVALINQVSKDTLEVGCDNGSRVLTPPQSVAASDGQFASRVAVTWIDLSVVEAGFRVYRDGSLIGTAPANANSFQDTSAVAGVTHAYCVRTLDAGGAQSTGNCDTGFRGFVLPPASVTATDGQYPNHVAVSWSAPNGLVGDPKGYRVYRGEVEIAAVGPNIKVFNDSTGASGTTYDYCVRTERADGQLSIPACDSGGRGVLAAPVNVQATDDQYDNKVDVAWSDAGTTEDGYFVFREAPGDTGATLIATLPANATLFSDVHGQPGVTYEYCVQAFTNYGARSGFACDDGRRAIILAPTGVSATDNAFENRVDISWSSSSTSAVLFNVYRNGVPLKTVSGEARSTFDDTGVPGVVYNYCVSAVTALEVESGQGCDNGGRRLLPPTNVTATDDAFEDEVLVSWNDASSVETGYRILRRPAAGGATDTLATLPANRTGYVDSTGVPGRVYEYSVAAIDSRGSSALRSDTGYRALKAPSGVEATDGKFETRIEVRWTDNSRVEAGYTVYRRALTATDSTIVATLPANATFFADLAPAFGVAYRYSVVAFDSRGTSSAAFDNGVTQILPPASVSASDTYTDRVVITWVDRSSVETGYRVTRNGAVLATLGPNASSYTDAAATAGVNGQYCVATVAGAVASADVCDAGLRALPSASPDPTTLLTAALGSNDAAANDEFGSALAISGDHALVGAPNNHGVAALSGAVYAFKWDGTAWTQTAKLTPTGFGGGTGFGSAVAIDGKYAVIGAEDENGGAAGSGAAYIFELNAATDEWVQKVRLLPANAQANADFGRSVAVSGDLVVVGEPFRDNSIGRISSYRRVNGSWSFVSHIPTPAATLSFGTSVALSGSRLLAAGISGSAPTSAYTLSGTTWTLNQSIPIAANGGVAMSGDHAALINVFGGPGSAATHFLKWNPTTSQWDVTQSILEANSAPTRFQLAMDGSFVLAGGRQGGSQPIGLLFHRDAATGRWAQVQKYVGPSGGLSTDYAPVAIHRGRLAVGGPSANGARGSVYFGEALQPAAEVTATDGTLDDRVQIRWKDQSNNEDGFNVYRDGVLIETVPANVRSYSDNGGEPGRTYEYSVAAFSNNFGASAPVSDFGWKPPDGNITGRVSTRAGSSVPGVTVCLDPSPNNALLFDGSGGHVTLGDVTPSAAFTLEMWINPTSVTGNRMLLSRMDAAGTSTRFGLQLDDGVPTLFLGGNSHPISAASIVANQWQHIALVVDQVAGTVKFFLDGDQVGTTSNFASSIGNLSTAREATLGMRWNGSAVSELFSGRIDDLRLWDGDRSASADFAELRFAPLSGDESGLVNYWPLDEGAGRIVTDLGPGLAYGRLRDGVSWTAEGAPIDVCVVTDAEGNYVVDRVRYGVGTTFRVVPSLEQRQFEPGYKTITLNKQNPVQNEVAFLDVTSYTVSGVVTFAPTAYSANCAAANIEILVDGVFQGATDAEGKFSVPVQPGVHVIKPQFKDHRFSPAQLTVAVTGDVGGKNFTNTTTRVLSGRVGGGCNFNVGTFELEVRSENQCFVLSDPGIFADSTWSIKLPPQKYTVSVRDVQTPVGATPSRPEILQFFENAGPLEADLTERADTLEFIYRAPIGLAILGFPEPPACPGGTMALPGGLGSIPAVPLLEQGEQVELTIMAFEDYGDAGLCALDEGTVVIFDEIIDEADSPVEIPLRDGVARYTTAANTPNIFPGRVGSDGTNRSYQKSITAVIDIPGRGPTTVTEWVVVTGHKPRAATFTSVTESFPVLILRDPPGDGSSAFVESGKEYCTTLANLGLESVAGGLKSSIKGGLRFSKGTPFWSTETAVELETENSFLLGIEATQKGEAKICAKTTQKYSTPDGDFLFGDDGDTFLGVALNLVFAKTDVLDFKGCGLVRTEEIAMGGNGFETTYLYTAAHIRGTVVPQLRELARLQPAQAEFYNGSADRWLRHIALNDSLKKAAAFKVNRSFSAGADYEFSASSDTTRSFAWSVKAFTSNELALGFTFDESGSGAAVQFLANLNFEYTRESSSDTTTTRTVGYTLKDDDGGDFFSVNVLDDPRFGTPVFRTVSGRSSCPWEPNTQPRDSSIVSIEPPVRINVDPEGVAEFVLTMTNASPSNEAREYYLMPSQVSNDKGASIFSGGDTFIQLPFFIRGGESKSVTLTVARGPIGYRYDDLELVLIPVCQFDYWRNTGTAQLADTVRFSVHFQAPCSDIRLFGPRSGWVYNAADAARNGNVLELSLTDFELEISETDSIESIGAEYRRVGTEEWVLINEQPRALIARTPEGDAATNVLHWNVLHVPDDSYELRAFTRCAGGRTFSGTATGRLDRKPPRPFGAPSPADSVLSLGEDIALTFDEAIRCATVNADSITLEILNPDLTTAPVTIGVACSGPTIKILPQSPSLNALEGQRLRARIRGVRDGAGNRMEDLQGSSSVEWTFEVKRNLFTWKQSSLSMTAPYRTPGQVQAILVNGTPGDLDYSYRNLPSWLVPVEPAGLLRTGEAKTVLFDITPADLAIGSYQAVVEAVAGPPAAPTHVTALSLKVDVVCVPPSWDVPVGNFEQSMTLVARLSIGGVPSTDPNDRLAAFVGNQLRGVGSPQFVNGQWLVFLTIYGNRTSGETVRFQAFDASDCRRYTSASRTVRFEADRQQGSTSSPEAINALDAPPANQQVIPLGEGWTWFSLNLYSSLDMGVSTVLGNLNPAPGDILKSQRQFAQFDPVVGWAGLLTELNNNVGYQARLSEAGTLVHEGQPVDVANTPVSVATGWNWIPYLPQGPLPINTALAGMTPQNGDVIKSQTQFAQYIKQGGTTGWFGNLTTMRPGLGYKLMMMNASSTQGSFKYPQAPAAPAELAALAAPTRLTATSAGETEWSLDPRDYQFNMTVTARLSLPDGQVPSENDVVAAVVNGEVRGLGTPQYMPHRNAWLVFLMAYSNETTGEAMTFQVYDSARRETFAATETIGFEADRVAGTIAEPMDLTITGLPGDLTPVTRVLRLSQNYPNPPQAFTTIQYEMPRAAEATLRLYDVAGRVVRTLSEGEQPAGLHVVVLDTQDLPNGLYFYRLDSGGRSLVQRMVIAR
jgi:hypothetical protein